MKKQILLLSFLLIAAGGFAQESGSKFHFGVKAVPSLAWLKPDTKGLSSDGSKFGFGYGLITDFGFADRYAFSTGIEVAYRGGKTKESFSDTTGGTTVLTNTSVDYTLQFIEVPITLKLKTNEIGYMTYFFQVGFAPGYAIRTKADVKSVVQTGTNTTTFEEEDVDVDEGINNFNISLIVGAGAEYNLSGNTSLMLGITFNNGFLDMIDGTDVKANSNYLGLMVGVLF